jgi:imidazolonepropionase-like amidohydrolase
MRFTLLAVLTTACLAFGQSRSPAPVEQGTLRLHYVQKPIGYEKYTITRDGDELQLASDFDFTDRGGRVQLTASLKTQRDFTPIHFQAKGKTYRFVPVDTDIEVHGNHAAVRVNAGEAPAEVQLPPSFFTVDGYSPFAAQMLLLRYWNAHGKPHKLTAVPGDPTNELIVESRGTEEIRVGTRAVRLSRYSIDGVVWGRETVWLDDKGALAAAISRAGGLAFEAVREDLEAALTTFVTRSASDGLADMAEITRQIRPIKEGTFALVGATVVDATGRPPIAAATVLIRDGRIADVGPRDFVKIPAGTPTLDVSGKTILPGLWDMHTHFTQVEWAPVYLAAGVTTVRDMGNEFEFITAVRDAISSGRTLGPRILMAGLIDGGGPDAFGVYYATTPEEAKAAVVKYHDAGFQQIKIYTLVKPAIVAAICTEAHRLGMTVTGHVPAGMTIEQAVGAGMDNIAHLAIRGEAGSDDVTKTIAFLRDHQTVMDPTQSWNELLGRSASTPISNFQPGFSKIPFAINRVFSSAGAAGIDAATARARLERGLRIVKALHDAGILVVAGTDEGVPGHSLLREIELYNEAGFTPLEAIQSATIVPARVMKLESELGTVERGKRADLVVLDADPLQNIRNIRSVRWTIRDGRIYDAASLWKSVRFQP